MYGTTRFLPLLLLMVLLSVATSGCDLFGGDDEEDDGGSSSDVSGGWVGDLATNNGTFTFTFNLSSSNNQLSGDGTISAGGQSDPITVTGTYSEPSVQLSFSDGQDRLDFNGALLAGNGFIVGSMADVSIVFERQDGDGGGGGEVPGGIGGIGGKRAPSGTLLESLKSIL